MKDMSRRGDASASAGRAERRDDEVDDVLQSCGDVWKDTGIDEACAHMTRRMGGETVGVWSA